MRKFKVIICIVLILFLSGCKVETDVHVSENGKVKESVKILIPSSVISNKKERIDSYVRTAINSYKKALETRNYKYEIINDVDSYSGALIYNKFDNICDYVNKTIFSQYAYKYVSCNENDYYYEIKSDSEYITYCSDCNDRPALENIKINLKLPVAAEENNADIVNNNTYTWEFDKYSSSTKSVYIKINKETLEKKIEESKDINQKKNTISKVSVIAIVLGIIASLSVISYLVYKKAKSNRLEL